MKAVVVTNRGSAEVVLVDREAPRAGPGELLVRVQAASVNPVDWKLRSGVLGRLAALAVPEIPGIDVAGVVEAVGSAADGRTAAASEAGAITVGTPVFGLARRGGAFAELAVVPAAAVARKPDALGFPQAAAIPVAGLTALQALRDRARLAAGQRLLVNGASGGVGCFAVQIGRLLGATVTAVTSTHNLELVRSLGAEQVIDYTQQDFARLPETFDVIFDVVANRTFMACASRLTANGVYITTLPGPANLAAAFFTGLRRGKRALLAGVQPVGADLAYLAELAVQGKVRPVVEHVLPLAKAEIAFGASRGGHVRGKLVLSVGAGDVAVAYLRT